MAVIALMLICAVYAYGEEKTADSVPDSTDISVSAKYVDNTGLTIITVDGDGNGSATLPDGTEVTINGSDSSKGRIIVEQITETEVLDRVKGMIDSKLRLSKVYIVYLLNGDGTTQPVSGVTVTITLEGSGISVYSVSEGKTEKLISTVNNGRIGFATDGSQFYAMCKKTGGDSPQTGDDSGIALWIAVLLVSGGTAFAFARRKKHE